ncbi:MAG: hypothetical protein AB1437_24370 [Pseudomonadota bacterium]
MSLMIVSAGAIATHNEDWAGSFQAPGRTDLVIIDGGTSVADQDYIAPENGDIVWFVRRFATALGACAEAGLDQHGAVHAAVDAVFREFGERTAGRAVPQYAWPIAAMSWVRISGSDADQHLSLYCLGDCKVLLRDAAGTVIDLDPWLNPQETVLRTEIARLQAEGVLDAAQRHARLLPLLRERRVYQNTVDNPAALCLQPRGAFAARTYEYSLAPGAAVLAMTDGFYRLVDTYGLHTNASLFALCAEEGPDAALAALRLHEADASAASASVKRADDASAILWQATDC